MEAYFDNREPGSYGGVDALYRLMHKKGHNVTRKDVKNLLAEQEAYNLHKSVRLRFMRRKIYVKGIDYLRQADLVHVSHLAYYKDGFLLTVIDVFSKFACVIQLKRKDSKAIMDAFETIFLQRKPLKLQTDKGKEFVNVTFQKRLNELRISFHVNQNKGIKASITE